MTTKTCKKCGEEKALELFAKGKGYVNGRKNECKKCHSNRMTEYYKSHPEQRLKKIQANTYYKPNWSRHKITKEQYDELVALYEGKCHSCKENDATNIDHDHNCCDKSFSCGQCVRGVLCHHCNTALGLLKDDVQKIQNLLEYIS
jgi:regulator of replication initiation timing